MKPTYFTAAAVVATALMTTAGAHADSMNTTKPRADHNPNMPAVVTDETPAQIAPAAGRNSFTQAQAMTALRDQGFTGISALKADKDGIWRGTATKGGMKQNVAVDYQGNVRAQ